MWSKIYVLSSLLIGTLADMPFTITKLSEGVKSTGYKIVYGDEDLTVINDVVNELEKVDVLKNKVDLNEALPPLHPEDVKCLMSVDRYCSKDMGQIKAVIIQAVKEDCKHCTIDEKEKAGKVIASVMAHDPIAWKLFLTRSTLIGKSKKSSKEKMPKIKAIGTPEDVPGSKDRYIFPGVKVRVKRYVGKKL